MSVDTPEAPDVDIPEVPDVTDADTPDPGTGTPDPQDQPTDGGYWPEGVDSAPDGFADLTPDARTDWLIDQGWGGIITADGYPVAADPWGDPLGDPTDPSTTTEPAMPGPPETPKGRRMGGPEDARRASREAEEAGKHGLVKGPGGGGASGAGKGGRKRLFGTGGSGGGSGIKVVLFDLSSWFGGWLSPRASAAVSVGSGNTGVGMKGSGRR